MVKVLITGGAGYIGTSLIPQVLAKGYQVTVFDNLTHGGNQLLPFFNHKNFDFIKGDIRDEKQLREVVKGKDIVIHLAAIVGFPACRMNPQLAKDVNVQGTINLINACDKNQVVFYGSTGSNYGAVTEICTEETPLNPLSLYGETKTEAEQLLLDRDNTIAYRFATAFGVSPRLRLDLLVNDFVHKAIVDGYLVLFESHFKRNYIHVRDIAKTFLFCIENYDKMIGDVFNVGLSDANLSKLELAQTIKKFIPNFVIKEDDYKTDFDNRDYIVSNDKLESHGWRPTYSIQDGIIELIDAYKMIIKHNNRNFTNL